MENKESEEPSKKVPFAQLEQVHSDFVMAMAMQEEEEERAFSMLETIESDDESEEKYDSQASYESNNYNNYEYLESLVAGSDPEFLEQQDSNDDEDMEDLDEEDEIDPDDLSYEELIALGEVIGVEKRGLSQNEISSCLIPCKFQSVDCKTGINRCVICQMEYEEEEDVVALPNCEHPYHTECISKWLEIKKICPICSTEISSSSSKKTNNVV